MRKLVLVAFCLVLMLQAPSSVEGQFGNFNNPLINKLLTIIGSDKYLADSVQYFVLRNTWVLELLPKVTENEELMQFLSSLPSLLSAPGVSNITEVVKHHVNPNLTLASILQSPSGFFDQLLSADIVALVGDIMEVVNSLPLPGASPFAKQILQLVEQIATDPGIKKTTERVGTILSHEELTTFVSALPGLLNDTGVDQISVVFKKHLGANATLAAVFEDPLDFALGLLSVDLLEMFGDVFEVVNSLPLPGPSNTTRQVLVLLEQIFTSQPIKNTLNDLVGNILASVEKSGFTYENIILSIVNVTEDLEGLKMEEIGISDEARLLFSRILKFLGNQKVSAFLSNIYNLIYSDSTSISTTNRIMMTLNSTLSLLSHSGADSQFVRWLSEEAQGIIYIIVNFVTTRSRLYDPSDFAAPNHAFYAIPPSTMSPPASPGLLNSVLGLIGTQLKTSIGKSPYVPDTCWNQFMDVFPAAIMRQEQWAIRMLDAWGKPQTGVLRGQFFFAGSWGECSRVHRPPDTSAPKGSGRDEALDGKYCRLTVHINVPFPGVPAPLEVPVAAGVCVPEACSQQDLYFITQSILKRVLNSTMYVKCNDPVKVEDDPKAQTVLGVFGSIACIIVIASFIDGLFLTEKQQGSPETPARRKRIISAKNNQSYNVTTTDLDIAVVVVRRHNGQQNRPNDDSHTLKNGVPVTDLDDVLGIKERENGGFDTIEPIKPQPIQPKAEKPMWKKLIQAISIYSNLPKILSARTAPGGIDCLHGLRFLSMCWVILGHMYAFIPIAPVSPNPLAENIVEFSERIRDAQMNFITNAYFAVDTFFFLSGLLVSYLFIKQMMKIKAERLCKFFVSLPYYYIHRYIRLTPLYLVVIFMSAYLMPYLGRGPAWNNEGPDYFAINCKKYWWRNILYIDNLYPTANDMCIGWGWYLSNDMQMYFVAPIFLGLMTFLPVVGVAVTLTFIAGSVMATSLIAHDLWTPKDVSNPALAVQVSTNEEFAKIYIKPWCRFAPYGVGLLLGYFLAKHGSKIKIPPIVALIGWLCSTALALALVLLPYDYVKEGGEAWEKTPSVAYEAVKRLGWGVCLGWLVLACYTGVGGVINHLLSWRAFVPLGRLTYATYLIHELVIFIVYWNRRETMYMEPWFEAQLLIGFVFLTTVLAFLFSVFFESPVMQLDKLIYKLITSPAPRRRKD